MRSRAVPAHQPVPALRGPCGVGAQSSSGGFPYGTGYIHSSAAPFPPLSHPCSGASAGHWPPLCCKPGSPPSRRPAVPSRSARCSRTGLEGAVTETWHRQPCLGNAPVTDVLKQSLAVAAFSFHTSIKASSVRQECGLGAFWAALSGTGRSSWCLCTQVQLWHGAGLAELSSGPANGQQQSWPVGVGWQLPLLLEGPLAAQLCRLPLLPGLCRRWADAPAASALSKKQLLRSDACEAGCLGSLRGRPCCGVMLPPHFFLSPSEKEKG
nr:uncharacterized protein LOC116834489 [Chelonoidis abingdonii]